jgi:integrase
VYERGEEPALVARARDHRPAGALVRPVEVGAVADGAVGCDRVVLRMWSFDLAAGDVRGAAAALINAPDPARWEGRRDRTLLTLAIYTGLRVSELTGLDCGDITLGTGANVRCRHSKGRKQRAVPLTTPARTVLAAWLAERAGRPGDPLFPTRTGRRLSSDAIAQRVSTHAATAAINCPSLNAKHLHPHALRHSCAMSLLQAGVDTSVIALWLGHADVRSTDAYIHADMTIKEKALALVTPPDVKPRRYKPPDKLLAFLEGL